MKLATMLGIARWPLHYHLHFNKNVDEKEKYERVHPKPLNPIMQDHNEATIYIYTYTRNNDLDLKFANHVLVFIKPNKTKWLPFTIRKRGVLQLALQLNFSITMTTCNSSYIWCNSLQLNCSFVLTTPFQLLCNSFMITSIMSC
jgi:hypothetical protein